MAERLLDNTIKIQRARKNWTQAELAHQVGVTRKTVNTIENGKYVPSTYLALKMARVLDVSVEELFQIHEDKIWGKSPFST
jgi:putative transcriptional regulator